MFTYANSICARDNPVRIMFFGDSICAGSDIHDGKSGDAWPALFQSMNKDRFVVDNQSRGGRPSDSFKELQDVTGRNPVPEILVIALGTNDSRDLSKDMAGRACENLKKMVALAKDKGVKRIILIGPYNINKEALKATYNIRNEREDNIKKLNAAFKALAAELNTEFLSMHGVVPGESMSKDGVHPDVKGEMLIAEYFQEFMTK
ncbi:MAG: SGNH/GDSL hydrolase family protein [Victivallales bacterium]